MPERPTAWAALALVAALGLLAWWRGPAMPRRPPPMPRERVQAWMADCLPGIGPLRREAAADALRAGRDHELPAQAREAAAGMFAY